MPAYRVYKVGSPFNVTEMLDVDYEQTADVIYFAHSNHAPCKLIRHGHTDWEFVDVTFSPTIAIPTGIGGTATVANTDAANSGNAYFPQPASYVVTAYNEDTGQESRVSLAVTLTNDLGLKRNYNDITWSAVAGATGYRVYKSENTQSYGLIGTTTSLTFRDKNIGPDLSTGPVVGDNPFVGAGNYPSTVTFHEQRSCWGRTLNKPNGLWMSRSADYENMDFTRPTREDDSIVLGLVANKVNSINQLHSWKDGLLSLTSNNIFTVAGANGDYLAATPPPRIKPQISRGSSRLNPIGIDNVVFYETAKSGEIRTIGYEYEIDGIRSDDISLFSRHLFENQDIVDWAWAEKPGSTILLVRGDGKVLSLTWDQAQQVWGWTLWETNGLFKRICVVTEGGEDRVYFMVEREIGGVAKTFVERMASALWEDQADACYLDCARSFTNGVAVNSVDRLDHLEGEAVVAWIDAQAVSNLVVNNGTVTFPEGVEGLKITVGLPFTAEIETLPLAVQTGGGWSVSRPQQAERIILKVVDSRNVVAGVDRDSLFEIKQRDTETYGDPISLLTGDLEVSVAGTSGNETVCVIQSKDPTPLHLAAVLVEPKIGDK